MTVYVGLVIFNSVADLPRCLDALQAQTYTDLRLLAWDNASSDQSVAWLRQNAGNMRLFVSAENLGYGRAHNALIKAANLKADDFYIALNPDAELRPNYIARLVEALSGQPGIGWGTGKILHKVGDEAQPSGELYSAGHGLLRSGYAFNIGYGLPDDDRFTSNREVFGAPGAAAIYKAVLIADISQDSNFFDPGMFLYAEDTDVDWRARRRGWRCWYVADAVALHRGSRPTGQLKIMAIANRYVSVLKNATLLDLLTYNLPYIIAHCCIRLIATPKLGVLLIRLIFRGAPAALSSRRFANGDRLALRQWYRWSARQPTKQLSGVSILRDRLSGRQYIDSRNWQTRWRQHLTGRISDT